MSETITGKVIDVIDGKRVVINKGAVDGVAMSQSFLVYRLGKEMFDPDTGESLGMLELVCGEGRPEHIQDKITTLVSCRTKTKHNRRIITRKPSTTFASVWSPSESTETIDTPESVTLPFEDIECGCRVKQIG